MPCPVSDYCKNTTLCDECAGNPDLGSEGELYPLLYIPINRWAPKHPRSAAKKHVKQKIQRKAARTETKTRDVIRRTLRSGAANGDGDTRVGAIGIDDKMQSTATKQFTVKVDEVDKAWSDKQCVVCITLATGRKFVVIPMEQLAYCAAEFTNVSEHLTHDPERL